MQDRTVTIRAIGDSSGVILPKAVLDHIGAKRGERLIAAPVLGGVLLIPDDSRMGQIITDALAFMDRHDDAFRELATR